MATIADYFNVHYATISDVLKDMKARFSYAVMQDLTPLSLLNQIHLCKDFPQTWIFGMLKNDYKNNMQSMWL